MKTYIVALLFTAFVMNQIHAAPPTATTAPKPLYKVTVEQTPAKAINYRNLKGTAEIDFKGTILLPEAKGDAEIKNNAGVTEIEAKFRHLTPATQFGPEYLTYVFWAISPEGRATNLGELIIKDKKSALKGKTPLQTVSLLVTAEPYFAVSQPSNVVVLENALKPNNKAKIELVDAQYQLLPRGEYVKNMSATDMQGQTMDKKTPFDVYQARNAVRIAKAAGAEAYATAGFNNAQRLLQVAESKEGGKKGQIKAAREAVQSAEDSRALTAKNQTDESLSAERQQSATTADKLVQAEDAKAKAELARGQSEAERAAALALATSAAASSTDALAEAKAARAAADEAKGQAADATGKLQQVEGEKAELRAQLLQQLNLVLQTKDTARGLIVNMSDALFKTGSSELGAPVREKLAKVAGIVSSHSGLKLAVEGHTDSVGSEEYNQRLSEKRAEAAKNYLVSQGVSADSIVSKGFGKTSPIASNDNAEGRQQNRRVEIIVSGEPIGKVAMAK